MILIKPLCLCLIAIGMLSGCRAYQTPIVPLPDLNVGAASEPETFHLTPVQYSFRHPRSPFSRAEFPNLQTQHHQPHQQRCQPQGSKPLSNARHNQYPLSQLIFKGVMHNETGRVALLALPEGEVVSVRVGQRIGLEYAAINAISAQKITLRPNCDEPIITWMLTPNE